MCTQELMGRLPFYTQTIHTVALISAKSLFIYKCTHMNQRKENIHDSSQIICTLKQINVNKFSKLIVLIT